MPSQALAVILLLSNAQQSCVPATAPKRKVAKLHFVCLSIFYLCTIYERMQLKVWRIENLRIEGPKSRSGGSKIEVQRVQNRGFGGLLGGLRSSWAQLGPSAGCRGPSWRRLGAVLEALWVRLGRPGGRLWGVLGSSWRHLRLSEGVLALRMEAERSIPSCMSFADRF